MYRVTIDKMHSKGTIDANLYGHFAEQIGGVFYDGIWVGEDSDVPNVRGFRKALVESFAKLEPPVLRWPGGCFAETYDWRDGIGPRWERPRRVNWWYAEDRRIEPNEVGIHEFVDFCRLTGAQPYVAANMTSVTPLHIRNWIEYCNFPAGSTTLADERAENGDEAPFNIIYWGIGNENWGGGGQMSPERCAQEYLRYSATASSVLSPESRLMICGANAADYGWTRRLLAEYTSHGQPIKPAWGMSVHYYNSALGGSDDVNFDEAGWYDELWRAAHVRDVLDGHRAAMDEFDPDRKLKLVIDEWGNWHKDGSGPTHGYNLFEQQSNMRDAVVAALELNIFNDRCDVVGMANIAQLCNNLHSLYLAHGADFVETPNYHVFDMFRGHKGGRHLNVITDSPDREVPGRGALELLSASASEKDGVMTITLANLNLGESIEVSLQQLGGELRGSGTLTVLSCADPNAFNTFEAPQTIAPRTTNISADGELKLTLPAASVAALTLKSKYNQRL